MKPFERSALTAVALLALNSSPPVQTRWDLRWATDRFAELSVVECRVMNL